MQEDFVFLAGGIQIMHQAQQGVTVEVGKGAFEVAPGRIFLFRCRYHLRSSRPVPGQLLNFSVLINVISNAACMADIAAGDWRR
jgi:hypothetical protein